MASDKDIDLIVLPVSKALTKKVLFLGVEKYFLKFVSLPFLMLIGLIGPAINIPIAIAIGINFMVVLFLGRFLAKKNPYWIEMAMRHLGYKSFYLAQGKYTLRYDKPWYRGTKGERTFEHVNRKD